MLRTIITATGKTFDSTWDGVATIDGVLRIGLVNTDVDSVHNTFKLPAETATLTRRQDGMDSVYTGYTAYRGFLINAEGEIVVALAPAD